LPSWFQSPVVTLVGRNPAGNVGWNAKPGKVEGCVKLMFEFARTAGADASSGVGEARGEIDGAPYAREKYFK
jgi:hypothetical protein